MWFNRAVSNADETFSLAIFSLAGTNPPLNVVTFGSIWYFPTT
jgi:hypothetical protein